VTNKRVVLLMVVMPILGGLTVGTVGAWLTGDLRVIGVSIVVAEIVGGALVAFFDWRAKLRRQILRDIADDRRVA
jgi:hypothetical protein